MTTEQHSSKTIAELERKIAAKEREIQNHTSSDPMSPLAGLTWLEIQLKELRAELSRFRNEEGQGKPDVIKEAAEARKQFEKNPHDYSQLAQRTIRALLADIDDREAYTQLLINEHAKLISTPPPLAPVKTWRGEREALEKPHVFCLGWPTLERIVKDGVVWFDSVQSGAVAADGLLANPPTPSRGLVDAAEWQPDADMRAELDRSELVARSLLKEIMKQIDYIESEGHIEWFKRIKLNGELYLPDLAAAVLAALSAKGTATADGGRDG